MNQKDKTILERMNAASDAAVKRMQPFTTGGKIDCEYSGCTCPIRQKLSHTTFSAIVTPEYEMQIVCSAAARHYAILKGVDLDEQ